MRVAFGLDVLQRLQERLAHRVHLGAVEGILHLQHAIEHLACLQLVCQLAERFGLA